MELLIIPALIGLGGALLYFGANGVPQFASLNREPFNLASWVKSRPMATSLRGRPTSHDAELVDLMNEMIAVREELSGLRAQMATRAVRPQERPHAVTAKTTTTPLKKDRNRTLVRTQEAEPVASRLPRPSRVAQASAPARRQGLENAHRRYVRAH